VADVKEIEVSPKVKNLFFTISIISIIACIALNTIALGLGIKAILVMEGLAGVYLRQMIILQALSFVPIFIGFIFIAIRSAIDVRKLNMKGS
jgi:bacteriorhodopsin